MERDFTEKEFIEMDIDYSIPEELQECITKYVDYLNNDDTKQYLTEDCYQMEILMELNWCQRDEIIPYEKIQELKQYYVRGGIHK